MEIILDLIGGLAYTFAFAIRGALWVFLAVSLIVGVCLVCAWTYGIYLALRKALRASAPKTTENK